VTGAVLVYFSVRNLTAGAPERAFANTARVIELEERLGLSWEHGLQGLIIGSWWLITFANWVYIWAHWPAILTGAVVLFVLRRPYYRRFRTTLVLSGLVGFVCFALFPVAPPRLDDLGLIDTVTAHSNAYRTLQPPGLTNQYAAMPSLHFGWNLALGIVLFQAFRTPVTRAVAVTLPILMGAAVIVTANHFVLDVIAGGVLVLGAYVLATRLDRTGPQLH
jgi:membrane-associated phospholipid phosphatase